MDIFSDNRYITVSQDTFPIELEWEFHYSSMIIKNLKSLQRLEVYS